MAFSRILLRDRTPHSGYSSHPEGLLHSQRTAAEESRLAGFWRDAVLALAEVLSTPVRFENA
ncbi:hypothetical protein [Halovivax cerinus]|uniref:Uncharacterized protein n=1 Tax=Halovivax cerinus TaxID=1487865 RepID=A0ABD5NPJ7_9EURY|nr:hypothetical protein [Halovivax cerinus]